jgi:hypothetical protein
MLHNNLDQYFKFSLIINNFLEYFHRYLIIMNNIHIHEYESIITTRLKMIYIC